MALQSEGSSPARSAQLVGNAFVEQYYKVLFLDPTQVYKFYEHSSVLSRPSLDGVMTSVTTMQGIKDKILSLDYMGCKVEIKNVDAQDSMKDGVIVLVTGYFTGKDNVERSFTQTFFLAKHAKGYYVLNDIFRFVDVLGAVNHSAVDDANENVVTTPSTPNQESAHLPNQPVQNHSSPAKITTNASEVFDSSDINGSISSKSSVVKEVASKHLISSQDNGDTVSESASNVQEDPNKISYASMVAKESTVTSIDQISTNTTVIVAPSSTQQKRAPATPKAPTLHVNGAQQISNTHTEVKGIYIGNLPSDMSLKKLDAIFKEFGPIKKDGIQIRTYDDGFCFGFVEFESTESARSAIQVHKITIGSKEAYITGKRSTYQAGNARGRFPSGNGESRNDNYYRNRDNFGEGRGYGRSQYVNRGEFSGQNRGPTGRNGEANQQRVYQNDAGRTQHSSSTK